MWIGEKFCVIPGKCFVIMPFSEENDVQSVYQNHVKSVLENELGFQCERADDIFNVGGVMQSIWEKINEAEIIITEMTGGNPNVLYELGIAHTLGKVVIMITQSMKYIPFDLRHLRHIVYEFKPKKIEEFEKNLLKVVAGTVHNLFKGYISKKNKSLAHYKVIGDIDNAGAVSFKRDLEILLDSNIRELLIDMSDVDFIGSSAVGKLLLASKRAAEKGISFKIHQCSEEVMGLLKQVKLYHLLTESQ